jgi:hypothetical protein
MQGVCSTIAWTHPAFEMPAGDVAEVLRPSLAIWAAEPGADKTLEEEMAKAKDKIYRAQRDFHEHQARKAAELAPLREHVKARLENRKKALTPEELSQLTIIQKRTSYYVFSFGEQDNHPQERGYHGPKTKDEVLTYARKAWQKSPNLSLSYINEKDQEKDKTFTRVMKEYATNAAEVVGCMYIPKSYYDADTEIFHEAIAIPRKDLEPEFNEQIAEWLHLLGGPLEHKLLDWLSVILQLKDQNSALYLAGASGAGKNLLASGAGKLFPVGHPTDYTTTMGDFNSDMFRCPFLFLDEGLPKKYKNSFTTHLRKTVGSSSFTFSEKYVSNRVVFGSREQRWHLEF